MPSPTRLLSGCLAAAVTAGLALTSQAALAQAAPAQAAPTALPAKRAELRQAATTDFRGPEGLAQGRYVVARKPVRDQGKSWAMERWTSPWVSTSFEFTSLVPSWQARTPLGSYLKVRARTKDSTGRTSSWDLISDWTVNRKPVIRRSHSGQDDDLNKVSVDTLLAMSPGVAWQLEIRLLRTPTLKRKPALLSATAVASTGPATTDQPTSVPGPGRGLQLTVPALSQMTHVGHYPEWGDGGLSWCSPTSLAMVLGFYGANPPAAATWAGSTHADGIVDFTAFKVYDTEYDAAGNWAFNTAYAGTRLPIAYVTRLHDLREAEDQIVAGRPLIVSVKFRRGELTGAPISSTAGHLMVITGFTATGDVMVNDPAARTNTEVPRIYNRAQFEKAWINGSDGMAYLLSK